MQPTFHSPRSVEEAVALLAGDPSARALSGGTDLIVQMRSGRSAPTMIVDLKRIEGLSGVRETDDGGFAIGAATPCTVLKEHAGLAAAWPGVVEAANLIGSVQVRNRATMAGNLCNASPAADSVPALVAAGAGVVVVGPQGQRTIPVEELPVAPGRTALMPGEIVVEFRLPAQPARGADAYLRSTPRTEMDIAVVGAGISLVLAGDGTCLAARVAIGAVAPTVLRVADAGTALVGTKLDDAALERMAGAVAVACRPIDDKRGTAQYRTAMAGVLAKRVARLARERAGEKA